MAADACWHDRLAELAAFREEGHDWPRHHHYDSEREHTLGVWIHTLVTNGAAATTNLLGST